MDTPLKFVIAILVFWLALGGLLQLFDMGEYQEGASLNPNSESKTGTFSFIWDMMTFNVGGIPSSLRAILNTFFTVSFSLAIYVLIRGQ